MGVVAQPGACLVSGKKKEQNSGKREKGLGEVAKIRAKSYK